MVVNRPGGTVGPGSGTAGSPGGVMVGGFGGFKAGGGGGGGPTMEVVVPMVVPQVEHKPLVVVERDTLIHRSQVPL